MDAIENLLTRGVDKIYPSREELEKVLRSGKKLRLYQGFDPTGAWLHIGHAVALTKLRQFQDLGHHVIFLIGDFTAMIGDPSGKSTSRQPMTRQQAIENAKTYKEQASKILRFHGENPVEIKYNSEWLGKMSTLEFLRLSNLVTYQQVIERDLFQERMKQGLDLYANELIYPLIQAYDSVFMDVDLEIGGTDQTFNMLMGRKLMKKMKQKEKFVMTVPLLTDKEGKKIGKTEKNVIALTDPPNEFYGKIMALGDDAVNPCFTLLTDVPMEEIEKMQQQMKPIDFKKKLAFELTKQFNDEKAAIAAQNEFEHVFQKRESPDVTDSVSASHVLDALMETGMSKSEAKRLLEQKAVDINGKTVTEDIAVKQGDIIKAGKKKFIKIT